MKRKNNQTSREQHKLYFVISVRNFLAWPISISLGNKKKSFLTVFKCNMCQGAFKYIVFCHSYLHCSYAAGLRAQMSSITVCFEW